MPTQLDAVGITAWRIILVLGGLQVVLHGLLGWLGSFWLGRALERERAKLSHENETTVARLKADLDRSLSATTAALSALAAGHQAAQERRLAAVGSLWTEVTKVREATRSGLVFFDILKPEEYDNALRENASIRTMVQRMRGEGVTIEGGLHPIFDIDTQRPFLPDELYGLFALYRQIVGRAMWLLEEGLEKGHVVPWYEDHNLQRIIGAVFGVGELERITAGAFKSLTPILRLLELRMLEACQAVVSGKAATEASLADAHELVRLASEMETGLRAGVTRP